MIELPESLVLADQITKTLRGKRVTTAIAAQSPHRFAWYTGDPVDYDARLRGRTVTGADVYSGTLRVALGDMSLLISTAVKYHAPGAKRPTKHQLLVGFDDGSAISCTVQMWGCMFCYRTGTEAASLPTGHITREVPTPLAPEFDEAYFRGLAEGTPANLTAKAFLATEQRFPGLGNGVLQDILWSAEIHPKRRISELTDGEWQRLHAAVQTVVREMVVQGGRDTERDLFGRPGGYRTALSRNTVGQPCPRCGATIRKEAYLGGAIYYCGQCQKMA